MGDPMAEVRQESFRSRAARKVAGAATGGLVPELLNRIQELEAEVQECRQLNIRVAELVDLLQELMLPLASQDQELIEAALAKYEQGL